MDERRRHSRKPTLCTLEIYSNDISRNVGKGFILDLNEGGMSIVSNETLPLGGKFSLHFRLKDKWYLDFFGTVVHKGKVASSNTYGIKFLAGQGTELLRLF